MAERQARRPWYLVLALLVCSGMGACGSTNGWGTIEVYRGAQLDNGSQQFQQDDNRKAVTAAFDKFMGAMDEERPRAFPISAAELVIGIAMFIMSAAAMTGRGGARRALVQLTFAQAALYVAAFFLTPKIRWAKVEWVIAEQAAALAEKGQSQVQVNQMLAANRVFYRSVPIVALILTVVTAVLVIFALTRQRSRAYYDSQSERPTEG